jgi:RHS repeat-associated protein
MEYSPNGKIMHKSVAAFCDLNGNAYNDYYQNDYHYSNGTNRLEDVIGNAYRYHFDWDANGNMLMHDNPNTGKRFHCWDEENRLMVLKDEKYFGYYIYDAGGQRTYKLNGIITQTNISGHWYDQPTPTEATLYASPYVVCTPRGYTKHYYAGNDRIASKIGGGGLINIDGPIGKWESKQDNWREPYYKLWEKCIESLLHQMHSEVELRKLYNYKEVQHREQAPYFYHPDHLGSASWITDGRGKAIQHLQYLPFGEPRVDQRTTAWNTMFTFSGKERDEESQYSYFGARYYNSNISIWLSVDPRASSYPGLTPYNYCANSPVVYRDPNGEDMALGAVIGGMFGFYQGMQIAIDKGLTGWAKFGYSMLGGLIGSSAGLLGGYIGTTIGAALGTTSFIGGFATSATAAAVSTTISSTCMAWMSGASFGNGLLTGFVQGQISGAISGLASGLAGGIIAKQHGGDFWTGENAMFDALALGPAPEGNSYTVGEGMDYSTPYAKEFSGKNMPFTKNMKGLGYLYADGTIPDNYSLKGDVVYRADGEIVWGTAIYRGVGKGTDVYLYKAAFTSRERLYLTMVHEYLHVMYNTNSTFAGLGKDYHHRAISEFQYDQARLWKFDVSSYKSYYNKYYGAYNTMLTPSKYGVPLLSIKPWLY